MLYGVKMDGNLYEMGITELLGPLARNFFGRISSAELRAQLRGRQTREINYAPLLVYLDMDEMVENDRRSPVCKIKLPGQNL